MYKRAWFLGLAIATTLLPGCRPRPDLPAPPPASPEEHRALREAATNLANAALANESAEAIFPAYAVTQAFALLTNAAAKESLAALSAPLGIPAQDGTELNLPIAEANARLRTTGYAGSAALFAVQPFLLSETFALTMKEDLGVEVLKTGAAGVEGRRVVEEWVQKASKARIDSFQTPLDKDQALLIVAVGTYEGKLQNGRREGDSFVAAAENSAEGFVVRLADGTSLVFARAGEFPSPPAKTGAQTTLRFRIAEGPSILGLRPAYQKPPADAIWRGPLVLNGASTELDPGPALSDMRSVATIRLLDGGEPPSGPAETAPESGLWGLFDSENILLMAGKT